MIKIDEDKLRDIIAEKLQEADIVDSGRMSLHDDTVEEIVDNIIEAALDEQGEGAAGDDE
jgi:hypothetical protein